LPIFAFIGFIIGLFFSPTVGGVIQLCTSLLGFSHLTILATMLYTGHYTFITGIITYLVFICDLLVIAVFEFVISCKDVKSDGYEQKDEVQ
jgi:hypothetical protein